ncbi:MAG: disulfide bond formation protein B [Ferrovibrio sp.]|jgi:disulfide bond formation protein DsbB|uniref:disulfide bond formation protein B n=1 Tax=Ferrovibrio sp. TaxID=1917215 RepID=UPI003919D12C
MHSAAANKLLAPAYSGLLIAVASAATLGMAFVAQYGFGLAPCELCLWQRWPYAAAIVFGLAALLLPRLRMALLVLASLSILIGGGIGVFHVGVEEKWWQGLTSCGGGPTPNSIDALRAQLLTAPVARCDEVSFRFLGLSMAGWNVLWSICLVIFGALAAKRAGQENK